jgi:hypothetical protein
MLSLNCKNVQHVKIYLLYNFEVNPITHFDRLCKYLDVLIRFLILLTVFELLPKTCNFTICSIFCNSGHVGWCTASPDTILRLDTLVMIQIKFGTWGKNDQHSKIYLPCNLITHFGVIALFSSNF